MQVTLFVFSVLGLVGNSFAANCEAPLGMTTGEIADSQIAVSSSHSAAHDKKSARLITFVGATAWAVKQPLITSHYPQVSFTQLTTVTAVATQGRAADYDEWVTVYRVLYHNGVAWSTYQESGQIKDFMGNADQETVVKNVFATPIKTRLIRINPRAWYGWISMRAEFYGCQSGCSFPLGISYGGIDSTKVIASSSWDPNHDERGAGLNTFDNGARAWCALHNTVFQFLQIDLGDQTKVTAVATQGRNDYPQWVTSYQLKYSLNGSTFPWYTVGGQIKTFSGNSDLDSVVKNNLPVPIVARYIRINPRTWHGHISMRVELFGCPESCSYPLGLSTGAIDGAHISTSSNWDEGYNGRYSRLHTIASHAAWCAKQNNIYQWLQGRQNHDEWVTSYHLYYSMDGHSWKPVTYRNSYVVKLFHGNSDRTSVVKKGLPTPIIAKHLRIDPRSWHKHVCMRAEFYGCSKERETIRIVASQSQ